jgi:hypothetical protein
MAFWGRDANEIERAQLSIMARGSKAPSIGRIQKRKTNFSKSSLSACNARPVHTDGPIGGRTKQKPRDIGDASSLLTPRLLLLSLDEP